MDKAERGERLRAGMAALDCAADALKQATFHTGDALKGGINTSRANDEIGKLQLRLLAAFEKTAGRKP